MATYSDEIVVEASPQGMFDTILNISDYPNYIRGIRETRVDELERKSGVTFAKTSVNISVRYFSGWITALVVSDASRRTIDVEMVKGPFSLAKAAIALDAGRSDAQCNVRFSITYATAVAVYNALVEKHKARTISSIFGLFALRWKTSQGAHD